MATSPRSGSRWHRPALLLGGAAATIGGAGLSTRDGTETAGIAVMLAGFALLITAGLLARFRPRESRRPAPQRGRPAPPSEPDVRVPYLPPHPTGQPLEPWILGTGWIEVVGERSQPAAFEALFATDPDVTTPAGSTRRLAAHLVPDPEHPTRPRAVAVWVGGNHVGYLSPQASQRWFGALEGLATVGQHLRLPAQVWASRVPDAAASARVRLATADPGLLSPANPLPDVPHVVLPCGAPIQVGEAANAGVVLRDLADADGIPVAATLHPVTLTGSRSASEVLEVRLGGQRVGLLSRAQTANLMPLVDHVQASGRLAVVRGVVTGNEVATRIVLHAAKAPEVDQDWLEAQTGTNGGDGWGDPL